MRRQLWPIAAANYARHALHASDRAWPETNCSVDLWIELLHSWGAQPVAALPFALAIDFEGDQWTFFKFPLEDLYRLYGVEVIELNVWDALLEHVEGQLQRGRPTLVEVDSFFLPDAAGTSYRREHVKSSIGIQALDTDARWLGYFHNASYFELSGDDFEHLFRLTGGLNRPEHLPPYAEVVKLPPSCLLTRRALVGASLERLRVHLDRVPSTNPFRRYEARLADDLAALAGEPLERFHRYAFATLRQCGAAFELAASYLRWLGDNGQRELEPLAAACDGIAANAKTLEFKTARAVHVRRAFDPAPIVDAMANAWQTITVGLNQRYGAVVRER
jgi:hypothetical protein